jgi:hypothetical protein
MRGTFEVMVDGKSAGSIKWHEAACHRRQPQVRDHRVQPPQRPAGGVRPVAAQLRARGAADVIVAHLRQHSGWRAA